MSIYRKNVNNKIKIKYGYRIFRPICWLIGHFWIKLRKNKRKHNNLIHLCEIAGLDLLCTRCNELWEDSNSHPFFFEDEITEYF